MSWVPPSYVPCPNPSFLSPTARVREPEWQRIQIEGQVSGDTAELWNQNVLLPQRASAPHRLLRHHLVRFYSPLVGPQEEVPLEGTPPDVVRLLSSASLRSRLAATRGSRLLKREYLNVNVVKTW